MQDHVLHHKHLGPIISLDLYLRKEEDILFCLQALTKDHVLLVLIIFFLGLFANKFNKMFMD